jgi:predicted DCC family thiol-disulfide oxidoreductase YuxK
VKRSSREIVVCYDGECEVCITAVGRLRRLDRGQRLRMVPFQQAARELPELASAVGSNALTSALHVIEPDGTWISGGAAVLRIAEVIPRLRLVARLGRLPVVDRLVEPMYGLVARHRHRLSRLLRSAG